MMKGGAAYIVASGRNGTITGSTSNLIQRTWQHRNGVGGKFTSVMRFTLLVWYEVHDDLQEARLRERRIEKMEQAVEVAADRRDEPAVG